MTSSLGWFLLLCVTARANFALEDVLNGQLARKIPSGEAAMWRGLSLGIWMAPLLFFMPMEVWPKVPGQWVNIVTAIILSAIATILRIYAIRFLPFGLRSAFATSFTIIGCLIVGVAVFGEKISGLTIFLCLLLAFSSSLVALGDHSTPVLQPRVGFGFLLCVASAALLSVATIPYTHMMREMHPFIGGYLWGFGTGVACVPWVLWQNRKSKRTSAASLSLPIQEPWPLRAKKVSLAAIPEAVGTAASATSIAIGPVGIACALSGLEIIFTALLGAIWHQERLGAWRWSLILIAVGAAAGIGLTMHD